MRHGGLTEWQPLRRKWLTRGIVPLARRRSDRVLTPSGNHHFRPAAGWLTLVAASALVCTLSLAAGGYLHLRNARTSLGRQMIGAIGEGDSDHAIELLRQGADPNAELQPRQARSGWEVIQSLTQRRGQPEHGDRALHLALAGDHGDTPGASRLVTALLERGADPRARDSYGRTPLMVATLFAHPDSVRALIKRGVDVNEVSANGWTALDALRVKNAFVGGRAEDLDRLPTVRLLKGAGAR